MKLGNTVSVIAAVAMAGMIQTAQATTTLGDLVSSGGSITVGDKTFSNFGWQNSDGLLNAQAANLIVTAAGSGTTYGLDWGGGIAVNNLGGVNPVTADLKLTYTVTVNNPGQPIYMIDQNYTPNGIPSFGQVLIGETVHQGLTVFGAVVGNSTLTLNPTDLSDPNPEAGDNIFFSALGYGPQTQLYVVKDILITANVGDLVGLSDVAQSFHEVPEPTTVLAGALLLLPLGASTLRILRKNRIG